MNRNRLPLFLPILLALAAGLLACRLTRPPDLPLPQPTHTAPVPTQPASSSPTPSAAAPSAQPSAAAPQAAPLVELRQWAATAIAGSEYGSSDWSANQATGAPNVTACGDNVSAWAAAAADSQEWIELTFATPVQPSRLNIHLSYNPTFISRVELRDPQGAYHQIFAFEPRAYPECPTVFSIDIAETGFLAAAARITIDQAAAPSWVEIDAVELIGLGPAAQPAASTAAPLRAASTQPPASTTQPAVSFPPPPGFLWRMGGEKAFDAHAQFAGLYGIDYDPLNDLLYAADGLYDVHVFDALSYIEQAQGQHIGPFKHPEMRVPTDVKVDAQGSVYVAAWGSGKVLVFGPQGGGEPRLVFGERGAGDGQFGEFSPAALAVGLDGRIYVHDRNKDAQGVEYDRVLVFSPTGSWLQTISLPDASFKPAGMDTGPDGSLYMAGFIGSRVLKYSPDGQLLDELGEAAIRQAGGGPRALAIDQVGSLYLALWSGGILKLDPQGQLLGQWGVPVKDGRAAWPEGGFFQPSGVAVTADGAQVFFTDTSAAQAYLTAFTFEPGAAPAAGISQWGSGAEGTSEDAEAGSFAYLAGGPADARQCAAPNTAWAPSPAAAAAGEQESLTVYFFDPPLIPTQVQIVISNHPSQVVKVELLDANGVQPDRVIYTAAPQVIQPCPYTLSIPISGVDYLVSAVRITLDLSGGPGPSQIDAVQLFGSAQ
ncbi:MAG: hypothetical protein ACKOC5_10945 [Chloroflexota bacterium]